MGTQVISIPRHGLKMSNYLTGFGRPYRDLFVQSGTSGNSLWTAFSYNEFDNPIRAADLQRGVEMFNIMKDTPGNRRTAYWYEIFRDNAMRGWRGTDDRGRLHTIYVSGAETDRQFKSDMMAPKRGWAVPNGDCVIQNGCWNPFYPGTPVPFETTSSKDDAVERLARKGLPEHYAVFFSRPDDYGEGMYAGRGFSSSGEFSIHLDFWPDYTPGIDRVGSRPRLEELEHPEIVQI